MRNVPVPMRTVPATDATVEPTKGSRNRSIGVRLKLKILKEPTRAQSLVLSLVSQHGGYLWRRIYHGITESGGNRTCSTGARLKSYFRFYHWQPEVCCSGGWCPGLVATCQPECDGTLGLRTELIGMVSTGCPR